MSDVLLLLALLIVVLAALYLVAVRPDLVASRLERMLRRGDPWGWRARLRARLLAVKRAEPESWYPPEAAEAPDPDPVDEHFKSSPRVVAGQDIDNNLLIAEMQAAYADYRAGRDIFAGAPKEH